MIPQKGAWYHRNVGKTERLIPVESELGEQYGTMKDVDDVLNVTRIREWPKGILRDQHFQ